MRARHGSARQVSPSPMIHPPMITPRRFIVLVAGLLALVFPAPGAPPPNPFFALCMDTHDAKRRSLAQQAELLKELGYDGAGHLWLGNVPERIQTLEAAGLKLFQIYFRVEVTPGSRQPYDLSVKGILPLLKGHDTQLAALVTGGKPSDESRDPRAVEVLREIADLAKSNGVKIALYPHVGDWLESVEDALRVAQKVDRQNVGIMFNLCHWLRTDPQRNYRPLLERAGPKLFAISINGADEFDTQPGWSRYIQPLDRGSFDLQAFLRTLRQVGYTGPIGLQCYGLSGDAREHLARSMAAWRQLNQKLTSGP
jgi:sugar phosphate isomerase/epimerase